MDARRLALLQALLDTPSPSGHEGPAQEIFYREARACCPDVRADAHGNVIARLPGASPRRILLAGHCDEIGLIVRYIDDDGYLFFGPIGGVDPYALPGQRVRLFGPKGEVAGVIGRIAYHLQDKEKKDAGEIKLHELWIDIGAGNRETAERLAPVGTPAVWGEGFRELSGGLASARDFDDKAGVFTVLETLRALAAAPAPPPFTVIGVSTIQEECGVWGAGPVAFAQEPDAAIAIDVTHATDFPGVEKKRFGDIRLGRGPVAHRGVKSSKVLTRAFLETAERYGIPLQIEAEGGRYGTDADPMAASRAGVPVNTLSVPLRYMHTAVETACLEDLDNTVFLLTQTLLGLDPAQDLRAFPFA